MVDVIADMPPVDMRVPPLREAVKTGQRLRVLYAIGPEIHVEPGAVWKDLKVEAELGIKHRDAWERIAVVSDLSWLWRAFELFSWMVPGEMRVFRENEFEQAKT
jgi:hypothetical protein